MIIPLSAFYIEMKIVILEAYQHIIINYCIKTFCRRSEGVIEVYWRIKRIIRLILV